MATTYTLGKVGLTIKGNYSATTAYAALDVVYYNGSSYVAKAAGTGVAVTNTTSWQLLAKGDAPATTKKFTDSEFNSLFAAYREDRRPTVRRKGNIVQLVGSMKPTSTIAGSATEYPMFALPVEYRPTEEVFCISQGSGTMIWMLKIQTDGVVYFARYRSGTSYSSVETTKWLPFNVTWIIPD